MLRLQKTVEKIIGKYGNLEDFYKEEDFYLKVKKPNYLDLVIEKHGNYLLVGYYTISNGDLISNPVFAFHIKEDKEWFILRLEQTFGDTICGGVDKEGCLSWNKRSYKEVTSFANNCSQEWKYYYL